RPGPPLAIVALVRFADAGSAAKGVRSVEERHVMPVFILEDVIGEADEFAGAELDPGFFERFAADAVHRILAEFDMAAWRAPGTSAVGAAPETKQDLTIAHHQHADTYKRAAALLVKTFRSAHDPPA